MSPTEEEKIFWWQEKDSEKSSNSDDEQANICSMIDIDEKVKVKTCSILYLF